ncbi:MAG: DUF4965 domain-containing protein [Muribaculaceae bacterium]|nr:DUF4965 domain-containing protein [Muribaculaceae bacterium]
MKKLHLFSLAAATALVATSLSMQGCSEAKAADNSENFRAPAVPLVTIDPYTSAWSAADNLYDTGITHWTGKPFPLIGAIKVDGAVYRFMGEEIPVLNTILPTAQGGAWIGKYVNEKPDGDWSAAGYDDSKWVEAQGAYGTVPGEHLARTEWNTPEIWTRRTFDLDTAYFNKPLFLNLSHDDDAVVYINGVKVVETGNSSGKDFIYELPDSVRATLKPTGNVIAAWCLDRGGLAFIDYGIDVEASRSRYITETAKQTSVTVDPMNTIYTFTCGPVDLKLTFTAPAFLDNLDLLVRPVNYMTYEVTANDGNKHSVELYIEAGKEWALNSSLQTAEASVIDLPGDLVAVTVANVEQTPLNKAGDDVRIDWGRFYLATDGNDAVPFVGESQSARRAFVDGDALDADGQTIGFVINKGETDKANGYLMFAYDDEYSIQYFGNNLRPYWNRDGHATIEGQIEAAAADYDKLMKATAEFDKQMLADADNAGGSEYARLCALAYRQAIAAHKLVESPDGELLWLSKENFSNGSIGTVDITYPTAPMFLLFNPDLTKGLMNHIFDYSEKYGWNKPFAAHDVGTYPLANGQTYGGDMPVEESGNMLILAAALAKIEGNADYAKSHWDTLTTWAEYLTEFGLDPENQLCTDDFAGHFAHNANLSVKAILGVASYGYLAKMLGKDDIAAQYDAKAREMAAEWEKLADDGDHYRLTFDKPGTWSQKYNMVWDNLLGLDIFNDSIMEKEIPYYLSVQNEYGLPLDNRETYTKTDWIMWTATMAPDKATFEQFVKPVYKFMNETTSRVPMSDWVFTDKPEQRGFQARAVVGGYFIKMLDDKINNK